MKPKLSRISVAKLKQITAGIRSGAYPHVAAQAFGMAAPAFEAWRQRAAAHPRLSAQAREIDVAEAQARLFAEVAVFKDQPRSWLEHGPGRDRPDREGWTLAMRADVRAGQRDSALLDPILQERVQIAMEAFAAEDKVCTQLGTIFDPSRN